MKTSTDRQKNPATRLPDLSLPDTSGTETRIRRGRDAPVIIFLHSDCEDCAVYVREVASHAAALAEWSARLIGISPAREGAPDGLGIPVLIDEGSRFARAAAVEPPAVVIADQWGQVHDRYEGADAHELPPPERLVADARYLAIRCPECEGEAF